MVHTMNARNVLQICHGYNPPFLDIGNQYARIFDPAACRVTTLYLSGPPCEEVEQATVAGQVLFFGLGARDLKGAKLNSIARLRKLLTAGDFDLVICHRYKAIYLTGLARIGVRRFVWIGVAHDFKVLGSLSRRLFVRLIGRGLNVLGVSEAVRDDILASCPGLAGRVFTLPNSVTLESLQAAQLTRTAARKALGLEERDFIIGTAGRLHPCKDQSTLIRAFAKTAAYGAGAVLAVMGEGRLEESLKGLCRELGVFDRVRFLGHVKGGPRYYRAFDLLALPSVSEPFGMVMIEAMAADVPVAASTAVGAASVDGSSELQFSAGRVDELAGLLDEVFCWTDTTRRAHLAKARERLVRDFSLTAFRTRFHSLPLV